jgi:hypothetical protein
MTREMERWAAALAVDRQHGDCASEFIAGRVRDLAIKGDEAGVLRWMAIADCIDALMPGGTLQ